MRKMTLLLVAAVTTTTVASATVATAQSVPNQVAPVTKKKLLWKSTPTPAPVALRRLAVRKPAPRFKRFSNLCIANPSSKFVLLRYRPVGTSLAWKTTYVSPLRQRNLYITYRYDRPTPYKFSVELTYELNGKRRVIRRILDSRFSSLHSCSVANQLKLASFGSYLYLSRR